MAEQTGIAWCDSTFNPWWGCEKVSPGCAHCYAEKVSNHRSGRGNWGAGHGFRFFGDKHWDEPLRWARTLPAKLGRRPRVFCASMADVFEDRPELVEHRQRLFALIEATPEIDWLVLTKRPEVAHSFYFERGWLLTANLWLGTSIENARYTWRADFLREIPAAVRFISAEPLLGSLYDVPSRARPNGELGTPRDLTASRPDSIQEVVDASDRARDRAPLDLSGIDWVIVGGESGPKARPFDLEHAREIIRACKEPCLPCRSGSESHWLGNSGQISDIHQPRPAVFVKQLGAKPVTSHPTDDLLVPLKLRDRKGGEMSEWPCDLWIREFPRSVVPA